ncbi:protein phosphatase 1 regulatory subunit [Plakobranchus ocellatus]|uniref:Protein phosphatase 1 regulatory subunit n=1 Tax=Plakobranchus ocellatus TaxID=259542 RepID=A0AAV4C2R1_9GAST|nr:protein phosphatase 1 regulatory subunit [Plakobranchus ocellatus]
MIGESKVRRISFSADSVLSAVVQDADTTELARILGAHGDEIRVNQVNHVGLTALHHGVLSNNLDAVKLLLCNGADVDAQDVHGFSPLHTAAACGFTQVASLLLLFGADAFALTAQREMPIDLARELGVVRLLSEEMRRRVHAEVYMGALLRSCARDCWFYVRQLSQLVLEEAVRYLMQLWKRRRWSESAAAVTKLAVETSSVCDNGSKIKRTYSSSLKETLVDGEDKQS